MSDAHRSSFAPHQFVWRLCSNVNEGDHSARRVRRFNSIARALGALALLLLFSSSSQGASIMLAWDANAGSAPAVGARERAGRSENRLNLGTPLMPVMVSSVFLF